MSSIVPLDGSVKLPAYLQKFKTAPASVNNDVLTGQSFPTLSIKGKVYTLVQGSERKLLTREIDGETVPRSSVPLVAVRANTKARTYYAKAFNEDDAAGAVPDCQSFDGITPTPRAQNPQAKKCALCPHSVWGSKQGDKADGKGTACAQNTRLVVMDPESPDLKLLLRVPPASRKAFAEAVKQGQARNIPYNALVLRTSFDPEAAAPSLLFKPTALVSDELYAKIEEAYDSDEVKDMLGLSEHAAPVAAEPDDDNTELDAAIAAKQVVAQAAKPAITKGELGAALKGKPTAAKPPPPPAPKPTPVAEEAPPPVEAEKPKAQVVETDDPSGLLAGLDALLNSSDD